MISKRLEAIAAMVPADKVVFDVGSDHALLPCYLIEHGIAQKVYAGDNKKGPLESALRNIASYGFEDKIIPVLSDGLNEAEDDVEVVIIAGMGYHTAIDIIERSDRNKYDRFIVQINKNADLLREYISLNNYTIIDESIIFDGFYYEIISFNTDYHERYSKDEIAYGPVLLKEKSATFTDYIKYRIKTLRNIIQNKGSDKDIENKIASLMDIIEGSEG